MFESIRQPRYTKSMKPFASALVATLTAAVSLQAAVDFNKEVLPILQQRCIECLVGEVMP